MSHRGLGFLGVCFGLVVVLMILNSSTLSGSLGNGIQPAVTQPPVIVVTETITKTVTKFVGVTETVSSVSVSQATVVSAITLTSTYTYVAAPSPSFLTLLGPYGGMLLVLLVGLTLGYGLSFVTRSRAPGGSRAEPRCNANHDWHTPPVRCFRRAGHEGPHLCDSCHKPFTDPNYPTH